MPKLSMLLIGKRVYFEDVMDPQCQFHFRLRMTQFHYLGRLIFGGVLSKLDLWCLFIDFEWFERVGQLGFVVYENGLGLGTQFS